MTKKVGRNEPCPCGSGKKYKKCCLGKENKQNRRLDELREKLNSGEINPLQWMMHFPNHLDKAVPVCEECADYGSPVGCEGGSDPIECFIRKKDDMMSNLSVATYFGFMSEPCPVCRSENTHIDVYVGGESTLVCDDCDSVFERDS